MRYGHWLLLVAFGVAYLAAEEEGGGTGQVHVWAGYVVGMIVVLRVLWGFIGPQRARLVVAMIKWPEAAGQVRRAE